MLLGTILFLFLGFGSSLKPASNYFQICHRSDPELASCIKNTIQDLLPNLAKGIPELNLAPLDPMFVGRIQMKEGNGNIKFNQTLTNLSINGLGQSEILNVTVDVDNNLLVVKMFGKHLDFDADYDMAGRLMVMDIRGTGKAIINFTDVTSTASYQGEIYKHNDVDYLRVKNLKWVFEPQGAKFNFSNLFNGDKILGEATNRFFNENWREVFKLYNQLPKEAFGTLMKDVSNRVYALFPYSELYPE